MNRMVVLKTDGTVEVTDKLDTVPPLDVLQKGVGGYIETVPFFNKYEGKQCKAFCNEEGKLHNLPLNEHATALWVEQVGSVSDVLMGDVVILSGTPLFMRQI